MLQDSKIRSFPSLMFKYSFLSTFLQSNNVSVYSAGKKTSKIELKNRKYFKEIIKSVVHFS